MSGPEYNPGHEGDDKDRFECDDEARRLFEEQQDKQGANEGDDNDNDNEGDLDNEDNAESLVLGGNIGMIASKPSQKDIRQFDAERIAKLQQQLAAALGGALAADHRVRRDLFTHPHRRGHTRNDPRCVRLEHGALCGNQG